MSTPSHQPDLGGKQQPVTGKGKVNLNIPKQGFGSSPNPPKTGK
jgi:hypothetical protein